MSESAESNGAALSTLPVVPTTPKNAKTTPSVKSTPYAISSTAAAAASGVPQAVHRSDAMHFITGDLQSTQNVAFDDLVGSMLHDVANPLMLEASTSPKELFEQVLAVATALCNAPTVDENAGEALDARTRIKKHMKQYCAAVTEVNRYPPFVKLANAVLNLLSAEKAQFEKILHDPDPSAILFHINHPQNITSTINKEDTVRRPDIVIVTEASARAAFQTEAKEDLSRSDLLRKASEESNATKGTNVRKKFPVAAILCNLEFKKMKAIASPPSSWPFERETSFSPAKVIDKDELLAAMLAADEASEISVPTYPTADSNNPATVSGLTSSSGIASSTGITLSTGIASSTGNSTSSKRKASSIDISTKVKKRRIGTSAYPTIVQSASYALQSINRAAGVMRVINMIVEDATLWVWFYDRQGAIQSQGLHLIKDFPRFVTLLAALQRFDRENWGFHHELEPALPLLETPAALPLPLPEPPTTIRFPAAEEDEDRREYVVTLVGGVDNIIYDRATLLGRATRVERVTVTHGGVDVPGNWVLKVAWPESTRLSEVEILNKAAELGEKEKKVRGHIPELLCSKDLECTTAGIRSMPGMFDESEEERAQREKKGQPRCGPRTCRLLVFRELHEIQTLDSDTLLKAFAEIVDCHRALWTLGGIKHCDISPGNLMWNPDDKFGVLNDFDLSRVDGTPHSQNLERTGTIPFLSIELLSNPLFRRGGVLPTYNHDCDSLKWAFLYICCVADNSEVSEWLTVDIKKCLTIKMAYLTLIHGRRPFKVNDKHKALYRCARAVYTLLFQAQAAGVAHDNAVFLDEGLLDDDLLNEDLPSPDLAKSVVPTDVELYTALKSSIAR